MTAREFFSVQPVQAALNLLFQSWRAQPVVEQIETRAALGRILATDVHSPFDLPEFRRSTVDGYAVHAADTFGASQSLPAYITCVGRIAMGAQVANTLKMGQAVEIYTGGMLPPGADAVVMIERTQVVQNDEIEILAPVAPGENVIQIGEDVARGDLILPAQHRLRPQDIGGVLAVGINKITVSTHPRVGILSCGDEIVAPDEVPSVGQIRDINAYILAGLIEQAGGEPLILGIARDSFDDYLERAQNGFRQSDILVITAGSSISTRDLTRDVINQLGQPGVLQHGLAVKPGKPTILAICDNKPVIGLPGNPVSALLVARQIVIPIIKRLLNARPQHLQTVKAILTSNIASTAGREDTIPVRLTHQDGSRQAEPVFGKSNLIYTLIKADGLVHVPLNSNGLKAGAEVEVILFEDLYD